MKVKLVGLIILLLYIFSFQKYADYNGVIKSGGDSWGYYAYLPATLIYHDLGNLQKTIAKRSEYSPNSVTKEANGYLRIEEAHAYQKNTIIKYTNGIAILYAPFFIVAHIFCKLINLYPADGFSSPYNWAVSIASLLYALLGLYLLWRLLSRYFSQTICLITITIIAAGSNLYYFSVLNTGMSHGFLFMLYVVCLFATDSYYSSKKYKYAILIGLSCGLISLIRPNELLVILIPLLWNVFSITELKERFHFILKHLSSFGIMAVSVIAINIPQIIYWKLLSGQYFFYSYTNEGFDFLHPHIKDGLLGFANGWLVYTPVMLFSLIGLFYLPKYFIKSALFTYIILSIHVYVIYSWWCWQYINGFGSRPMVEMYALLSFPLACFFTRIWYKLILKYMLFALISFLIFLNLFQTWQFHKGLIWTEDANFAFYKALFLKTKGSSDALIAYDSGEQQPDSNRLYYKKNIYTQDFEDSISSNYITRISHSGKYVYELHNGYIPEFSLQATQSDISPLDYLKISAWVYCEQLQYNHYKQAVLIVAFKHLAKNIRWRSLRLQTKISNNEYSIWHAGKTHQWQYVYFYVQVPHRFKAEEDVLKVFAWNPSDVPIILDDIKVEHWKGK